MQPTQWGWRLVAVLLLGIARSAWGGDGPELRERSQPEPAVQTARAHEEEPDRPASATPPAAGEPARLVQVEPRIGEKGVTVLLHLSEPASWEEMVLANPLRLVVDVEGARLGSLPSVWSIDSPWLHSIRLGQHQEPLRARIVFDLPQAVPYKVEAAGDGRRLVVQLGEAEPLQRARFLGVHPMASTPEGRRTTGTSSPGEFRIDTDAAVSYRTFYLKQPARVVVDLLDTCMGERPPVQQFATGPVAQVRVGQFDASTTRVVLDLRHLVGYRVDRVPGHPASLVVRFHSAARGEVVVVDAGHGGKDPGASGLVEGVREKHIVLDIAQRIAELLQQHGVTAMLTRSEDVYLSLQERVDFANQGGADVFVSVHCNAFPQRGARSGVEIYYWTPQSAALAELVRQEYLQAVGLPDLGVRNNQRFFVIRHTRMPSVLVETGYLDHEVDGRLLNDPDFRQRAAQGICNGVLRYLGQQPPRTALLAEDHSESREHRP